MALLNIDDAIIEIEKLISRKNTQILKISDANKQIIAKDIKAKINQPPFKSSAMDGYAITMNYEEVLEYEGDYELIGMSTAGKPFMGEIGKNQAIRIFTGAVVPDSAQMVVMQENIDRYDDKIRFKPDCKSKNTNIRKMGGDFLEGETLIKAGTRLDAYYLSLLAASGISEIECFKAPKIAILCNGDELVMVGNALKQGQIYESASYAIAALCQDLGASTQILGNAPDDKEAIKKILSNIDADLLITIGGASVGDYDLVQPALKDLGFKSSFYKVNIKPGKPTWAGKFGKLAIIGLPGNPASAMVCAQMFIKPYILGFMGQKYSYELKKAFLAHDLKPNGDRVNFARAKVENIEGRMIIKCFNNQDSSMIKVFSQSNALLMQPANQVAMKEGDLVEYLELNRN